MHRFASPTVLLAALVVLSISVILSACSDTGNSSVVSSDGSHNGNGWGSIATYSVDTVNPVSYTNMEMFGVIHNEALDRVYDSIMISFPTTSYSYSAFTAACSTQVGYYVNFVSTATSGQSFSPVSFTVNTDAFSISNFADTCSTMTTFQRTILKKIDSIMTNTPTNQYANAVSGFNTVKSLIDGDGTPNNKPALYAVLAIARYSCQYWAGGKGANWLAKINAHGENYVEDYEPQAAVDWGTVAKADVGGLIRAVGYSIFTGAWTAAAVEGAVVGGLISGGTLAVPGAIVGALGSVAATGLAGAASASALALALELLF